MKTILGIEIKTNEKESLRIVLPQLFLLSSRGGLGVERLLHKRHDSAPVDQIPLGACLYIALKGPAMHI